MKYEELVEHLRRRQGRFAVANALIRDRKGGRWNAFGSLSFEGERFLLELMTTEPADLSMHPGSRVIHRRGFWDITGQLEGKWRFRCMKIPPSFSSYGGLGQRTTWVFSAASLVILHAIDERQLGISCPRVEGLIPRFKVPVATEFTITTTENSFEKTASHSGPVLRDGNDEYEYGLITNGADLRFLFLSKQQRSRVSPLRTKRHIESILASLSFLNGIDARLTWFAVEYGGRRWFERFLPDEPYRQSIYRPFEDEMLLCEKEHCLNALRKLQEFIATTPAGDEAARIQQLLRQVTGRSLGLQVLAAVVLFERMVDLAYAMIPTPQQDAHSSESESAFSLARREILDFIESRMKEATVCENTTQPFRFILSSASASDGAPAAGVVRAYRRLRGALGLKEKQTREKWLELSAHYALESCDGIFDAWSATRPIRAHGGIVDDYSEASIENDLEHLSLITSGINVLFLKMAGYSGPCTKWKVVPQRIPI